MEEKKAKIEICTLHPNYVEMILERQYEQVLNRLNLIAKKEDGLTRQMFRIKQSDLDDLNVDTNLALVDMLENGMSLFPLQDYYIANITENDFVLFEKLFEELIGVVLKKIKCKFSIDKKGHHLKINYEIPNIIWRKLRNGNKKPIIDRYRTTDIIKIIQLRAN